MNNTGGDQALDQTFARKICDAAQEYIERGFSVFPLSLGEKRPLAKWKRFQSEIVVADDIVTGKQIGRAHV